MRRHQSVTAPFAEARRNHANVLMGTSVATHPRARGSRIGRTDRVFPVKLKAGVLSSDEWMNMEPCCVESLLLPCEAKKSPGCNVVLLPSDGKHSLRSLAGNLPGGKG